MSNRTTTIYSLPDNSNVNNIIGCLLGHSLSTKFTNPIVIIEGKTITVISDSIAHSKEELNSVFYGIPH